MRRFLQILCVAGAILFCSFAKAADYVKFYKEFSPAVALVEYHIVNENAGVDEWFGLGSAFALDPYTVVTAAHCFNFDPDPTKFRVVINGKTYGVKKLYEHLGTDTGVFGLNSKYTGKTLKIAPRDPEIGAETFTMGNPLGFRKVFTTGYVSYGPETAEVNLGDKLGIRTFTNMLGFTNLINHGDSGGPVLGSKGQVYGVVSNCIDDPFGYPVHPLALMATASQISACLKAYRAIK